MAEKLVELDWNSVVLLFMVFFAILGWLRGWQRGLVTLVSLFFAWGIAIKTVDFLISVINFLVDIDLSGDTRGFFQIVLYAAAAVMVIVTFNSRVIQARVADTRDRVSGTSVGLLNGYFFVVLLLDLGREWLATHFEGFTMVYSGNLTSDSLFRRAEIIIEFINNPYTAYEQLIQAQNLILLFLLLVFWHGLLFALLGRVDKSLRTTSYQ